MKNTGNSIAGDVLLQRGVLPLFEPLASMLAVGELARAIADTDKILTEPLGKGFVNQIVSGEFSGTSLFEKYMSQFVDQYRRKFAGTQILGDLDSMGIKDAVKPPIWWCVRF